MTGYSRRRRKRSGVRAIATLILLSAGVYLITVSPAGRWLSEKVMAPAFSALAELPAGDWFSSPESSVPDGDVLSVSLSSNNAVTSRLDVPAISCFALQLGAFSSMDNAEALSDELKAVGDAGYVYSDGGVYRVLTCCYETEPEARTAKEQLKSGGTDCAVYEFTAPSVALSVTASAEQAEQLSSCFSALSAARSSLCSASAGLENGSMTESQGAALLRSALEELSATCTPLETYRESAPAIGSLLSCCDKYKAALSSLSASASLRPEINSTLIELSALYSDMLKGFVK